ncbi:MAG: cobalt ECF transporter T component CbiQ [Fibrobacterota bacterium]
MTPVNEALLHSHSGHYHSHPAAFFARFDARAVLFAWLAYTVLLISVPKFDLAGVVALASLPLLTLLASGTPMRPIFRRIFYLSPFILLAAAANPFLDRAPYAVIAGFTISAGLVSGLVIVLKAFVSVLTVLTLSACLPFDHLCHALRRLHAPEAFTTQLMLLYRYTFVLAAEGKSMRRARDIRSFGSKGKGIRTTASLLGALLLRSMARAGRVHGAMLSRGFRGTVSCCQAEHAFNAGDALFVFGTVGASVLLRSIF